MPCLQLLAFVVHRSNSLLFTELTFVMISGEKKQDYVFGLQYTEIVVKYLRLS